MFKKLWMIVLTLICEGMIQSVILAQENNTSLSVFTGMAGAYEDSFQGRKTTSGELYDENKLTASHRTLPVGTILKITNLFNGRVVIVKINDQKELIEGRILSISKKAASVIGLLPQEVGMIQAEIIKQPSLTGKDFAKTQQIEKLQTEGEIKLDSEGFPETLDKIPSTQVNKNEVSKHHASVRGIYILQFGAFQNQQSAEFLRRSLAQKGISTYIATVIVGMKKLYKVRLSTWYRTEDEIVQIAADYLEKGFECFIIGKLFISLDG